MKIRTIRGCLASASFCFAVVAGMLDANAQITGGPPSTSLSASVGSGNLNFQPNLFTGHFTYTVPVTVPPGRQGNQPNLALLYDSSFGNGWCGVGWKFEIGKIERQTRHGVPVLWTTNGPPTRYDDNKSFVFSVGGMDQDLVQVSSNSQFAVYRLSVDKSFVTFNYFNSVSNAYWSMVDKGGTTYFYGESISNRVDNPSFTGGYGTNTFRWQLDRVVDANGNATYITYTNVSFGSGGNNTYQLCPLQISYNANTNSPALSATDTINFVLTNNRPDTSVSFISDFRMESRELLSQIVVKADGQKVRRYVLNYTNSPSTLRSLLASVVEYGTDDTNSLPAMTFSYQVEQFGFGALQSWPISSEGQTGADWNSIAATDANGLTYVEMIDMDGDGLPDRVMRSTNAAYNYFVVQRNTGTNFVGNYIWGGLNNQGQTNSTVGSITDVTTSGAVSTTTIDLFDINGDGKPDRVMNNFTQATNWWVQINGGTTNGFLSETNWGNVPGAYNNIHSETSFGNLAAATQEMIDMNGDGLVDRNFGGLVQFNTGKGFSSAFTYPGIQSTVYGVSSPYIFGENQQIDLNGDGLPDIVSLPPDNYFQYYVNFNDGMQMETANTALLGVVWQALNYEYLISDMYQHWCFSSLSESSSGNTWQLVQLIDINGDGLPDRVMDEYSSPYFYRFLVQLNTGSGFSSTLTPWTNVTSEAGSYFQAWNSPSFTSSGQTLAAMIDINGDGLPDRVMRKENAPYNALEVQLNLGPFPDLLCCVSNGIGGSVQVAYTPSTKFDNSDRIWTNDPWAEGAESLLPFPVYTVSAIAVNDGLGNSATNTYAYQHGRFDPVAREFCGFNRVAVTDPYGARTVTYFHQSGGFDDSPNGEFQDQGSFSKKGMPYRVETWDTNGLLYQVVLNKVQESILNSNGWYFSFVSQSIVMTYEGLASYRAVAKQFSYDTNTENLVETANLGEVANVVVDGQTFTDVGNDSIYSWITYTNIGNILNKPSDVKNTSDSAGTFRLRETQMAYDSKGRMTSSQVWLDSSGTFISVGSNVYDQYGNLTQTTDAAGIITVTTYDSTYNQFPVMQTTGTFVSSATFDNRSGVTLTSTDAKGLISSNTYDSFFRPIASYISTNSYASPTLWQTRTFYSLGGISGGVSYNFIHSQVNDAVDAVNGFETYNYSDGLGRTIETRAESETGQFRVANSVYDLRGNPSFQTLPYFSSGANYTALSGTYLGALTVYDNIGRAFQITPAVNGSFSSGQLTSTTATGGDTGSPVNSSTTAFVDGSNPWATVVTDANGKMKKSFRDAYGRTITITEVTTNGNYNTSYIYDLLGNPTNMVDGIGNSTMMNFDSLGRKTSMTDPDMGTWSYVYDNAGRMTQQTDARTNTLKFFYTDQLGRLTTKLIYNSANVLVGTVTNIYDTSDDPGYTVFPGQLYKVVDLQGYQRSSYDVRGRVVKSGRFLKANSMEYVTQATYDDADRVQTLTYPGNAAALQYTYDTGDNLIQVKSTAGTGTNEIFYTPQSFNALGQLTGYTNGNGVVTVYAYYANSKRLTNFTTSFHGTNYQNLSYTYDKVSEVASINDGVYSGSASASITSVAYDDFYRITSINSTARGTKTYSYSAIGNILTNQDFGPGAYTYGAKPHAVTSANGVSYGYDACGNMTTRGSQTLTYDSENQLALVKSTNDSVAFGYDDSGERLWRAGTNGYTLWIGGIYEINNGKVLCHVLAGGQLIATFEPQCNAGLSQVFGEQHWFIASNKIELVLNWPFQQGRAPWTFFAGMWAALLSIGLVGGRRVSLKRYELRRSLRSASLWRSAVTVVLISAFLWASIGNVEAAPVYNPVFYYYHTDHLGSTNVMTDRSGNVVQHYEFATFGQSSYQNNTSAFPVSNRYTGQTDDDETGLYYYGARYYDPQLGRFIQPDTTVQSPDNPQTLNRYSYCGDNPLNYVDPSGHIFAGFIGAIIGGIVGGIVAGVTGHNIIEGIIGGAIAGFLVGCGIYYGGTEFAAYGLSGTAGATIGGVAGGAAGGAADASITGGNIGQAALFGGILGGIAGSLDPDPTWYMSASVGNPPPLPAPSFLDEVGNFFTHFELTPGQASGLGGAATAASTAAMNGSIGAPNVAVSFIPVIGSAWESIHDFSGGHWIMGTAYAAMAVLDVTGVGEIGDLALKGALKVGDRVIAETLAGSGHFTSQFVPSANEALSAGEKFLGSGYSEIGKSGSGVFRSADGLRQFRMDANSIRGMHAPNVPHVHFEVYRPGAAKPFINNHVPFKE